MNSTIQKNLSIRQDLFDAIKFDGGRYPSKNRSTGKQLGAHFVFAWIFEEAWAKISIGLTKANKYKFHSTQALFDDDETWLTYEKPIRIAFGRCLAYFVENDMLPLACVNPWANNKLYRVLG